MDVRVFRSENVTPCRSHARGSGALLGIAGTYTKLIVLFCSDHEDDDGQPGAEDTCRIGRPNNLREFVGCTIAGDVSKAG